MLALLLSLTSLMSQQNPTPSATPSKPVCSAATGSLTDYKVRKLKIEAPRWMKLGDLHPPRGVIGGNPNPELLKEGELYTDEKEGTTNFAIKEALGEQNLEPTALLEKTGNITVGKYQSCIEELPAENCRVAGLGEHCVDVTIHALYVAIDFYKIGNHLLPVPRTNRLTIYDNVPKPLRFLNPTFGGSYDRTYGPAINGSAKINLLSPAKEGSDSSRSTGGATPAAASLTNNASVGDATADSADPSPGNNKLQLRFMGDKSLDNNFYRSNATMVWGWQRPGKVLESVELEGSFDGNHEPFGLGQRYANRGSFGLNLTLQPKLPVLNTINLSFKYRRANVRFLSEDGKHDEAARENAIDAYGLIEGRLWNGLSRFGFWFEDNSPVGSAGSYQRLSTIFGYEKEIPLKLNQTIGLEVLLGGGRAWGNVPQYARFHGGNSLGSFLYDDFDTDTFTSFPAGPLLRSVGRNQSNATTSTNSGNGATSFWHFNLNASFPLPALSYPLIPNESISDDDTNSSGSSATSTSKRKDSCGRTIPEDPTLKNVVKGSIRTARASLRNYYKKQGLTDEQAEASVKEDMREIQSTVCYVADYANIYALKPLFMLDAARLTQPGEINPRTHIAIGGGIQFTLFVARFELGYIRSVSAPVGEQKGNLVLRLVFQNFF